MTARIREGRDGDAAHVISIVAECWIDYPGCVLTREEAPELERPASHFADGGGRFWVAEVAGSVAGFVGILPRGGEAELCKLYVSPHMRGQGLGRRLIMEVVDRAGSWNAASLDLWSDTRFWQAHRLYEFSGFRRTGETRTLNDIAATIEARFLLDLHRAPLVGVSRRAAILAATQGRWLASTQTTGAGKGETNA